MKDINKNNNKNKTTDFDRKKDVGNLGEEIACTFLIKKGFRIIERNYLKKWGEIDIIAIKDSILTFIEVKSRVAKNSNRDKFRPEENVHHKKQARLRRTIQTYIAQAGYGQEQSFLFHIIVVSMNLSNRRANITFLENIIL